jgi:uncharacterized protein
MVHISQLSSRYVRDPHDVVTVGEIVKVWVLELDKARRRVALTMIQPGSVRAQQEQRRPARVATDGAATNQRSNGRGPQRAGGREQGAAARSVGSQPSGRNGPPTREPAVKTYTARASSKPAVPLSKKMREGKEPLRTFGDLKQFFQKRDEAHEKDEAPENQKPESLEPPR